MAFPSEGNLEGDGWLRGETTEPAVIGMFQSTNMALDQRGEDDFTVSLYCPLLGEGCQLPASVWVLYALLSLPLKPVLPRVLTAREAQAWRQTGYQFGLKLV